MFFNLIVTAFVTFGSTIAFYNYFTAPMLYSKKPKKIPLVSVLIPARNEEKNIARCLDSVIKQDYKNYEILVLDDKSEDNTSEIIKRYAQKVKLFQGTRLPENWTGKNWACHNLSKKAKGELFLFVDADIEMDKDVISSAVALYQEKKVKMLSCFPRQKMISIGEWLVVPIIDWLSLFFIPLNLVYRSQNKAFSLAIGQFILIDKKVYNKIDGHKGVARSNVEDMELVKKLKSLKYKVITVRSTGNLKCYMYDGLFSSIDGLSRSFYRGAGYSPIVYTVVLAILFFSLVLPFYFVWKDLFFLYLLIPLVIGRIFLSRLARQNILLNVFLMPIHGFMILIVGINSMYISLTNRIIWKGRKIPDAEI
jgi:glycosyltransferase involved in cell wall biosynthesis